MEVSSGVTSPAGFSSAVREVVLEVLEECADSLAVYQNILRQQSTTRDDATNIFPNVEYVERIQCNKTRLYYDASIFVYLSAGFRKRLFYRHSLKAPQRWRIHGRKLRVKSFDETGWNVFSLSISRSERHIHGSSANKPSNNNKASIPN